MGPAFQPVGDGPESPSHSSRTSPQRWLTKANGLVAAFVPDHSGGSTVDSHHLPSWSGSRRTPAITTYLLVKRRRRSGDGARLSESAEGVKLGRYVPTRATNDARVDAQVGFAAHLLQRAIGLSSPCGPRDWLARARMAGGPQASAGADFFDPGALSALPTVRHLTVIG